jgi:hypothetical protein
MAAELIPQSKLFGNADKAEPKIAPDGKRYAYLASSAEKGVSNVPFCSPMGFVCLLCVFYISQDP